MADRDDMDNQQLTVRELLNELEEIAQSNPDAKVYVAHLDTDREVHSISFDGGKVVI